MEEITSIEFSRDDIIEAINEIRVDSATSDGETPARIIKACKYSLAHALELLWKASFSSGKIPLVYKQQYITHGQKIIKFVSLPCWIESPASPLLFCPVVDHVALDTAYS